MVVGLHHMVTGSEYGSRPTDIGSEYGSRPTDMVGVNMVVGLQIWWE